MASGTVLFVDDDPAVVASLACALGRGPHHLLTATSGSEALALLARQHVDVVVSDHQMPSMTGVDLLTEISRRHPAVAGILLTGHATLEVALDAVNSAHACRVLLKPCARDDLRAAIEEALSRASLASATARLLRAAQTNAEHRDPPAPAPSPAPLEPPAAFSPREREVLDLLAQGRRTSQIAKALFVSQHTVRNHLKAMFRKAAVHSQAELVALVRREG